MWSGVRQKALCTLRQRSTQGAKQLPTRLVHVLTNAQPVYTSSNTCGSAVQKRTASSMVGDGSWSTKTTGGAGGAGGGAVRTISANALHHEDDDCLHASSGTRDFSASVLGDNHADDDSARQEFFQEFIEEPEDWADFPMRKTEKQQLASLSAKERFKLTQELQAKYDTLLHAFHHTDPPLDRTQYKNRMHSLFRSALAIGAIELSKQAFLQFDQVCHPSAARLPKYENGIRVLIRTSSNAELFAIFEKFRNEYHARNQRMPELFYRYGVHALCGANQCLQAMELLHEMIKEGIEYPNECYSIVMVALAQENLVTNKEAIMNLFGQLKADCGVWNYRAVDRIIVTLSAIKEPKLAFDFYMQSKMQLTSHSLMALLQCCRENNCVDQAHRILNTRKQFNVRFHAGHYNKILETREWLRRVDQQEQDTQPPPIDTEMESVLKEMIANKVSLRPETDQIIARNQQYLQNTDFDISLNHAKPTSCGGDRTALLSEYQRRIYGMRLTSLIDNKEYDQAADTAKLVLKALARFHQQRHQEYPEQYNVVDPTVPPIPVQLATQIVDALMVANQHAVLLSVVEALGTHKGQYGRALLKVVQGYHARALKNPEHMEYTELCYQAMKAMEFQGLTIRIPQQQCQFLALRVGHGDLTEKPRLMKCLDRYLRTCDRPPHQLRYFEKLLLAPGKWSQDQVRKMVQPLRVVYGRR